MCELNKIICKTVECQAKVTIVSQYHSLLFYFNEQYINIDQYYFILMNNTLT